MSMLMLTCKEASRLSSEALDRKLSLWDRVLLRMHLALCHACSRVNTQYKFLRRAVSELAESSVEEDAINRR